MSHRWCQHASTPQTGVMLVNTAGELEREACSRSANALEAFLVMALLLGVLWWVAYPFAVLHGSSAANLASRVLIACLVLFAAVISPWWHRDALASWGLGNPLRLWRAWRRGSSFKRSVVATLLLSAIAALTFELYRNATGAGQFVLGIEPEITLHLQSRLGGEAVVLGICLAVSILWATCIVRYDNLWPALKAAVKILAILLPLTLLVGWASNGSAAFRQTRLRTVWRNGLGYVFWGALQQLLFCSYFGTRLRKGFAPAMRPACRPRKRLAVAVLNGLFFGLVHINSWLLVGFTWTLGSFLSWYFMEDRHRNLQGLGLVHGVLGTCVIALFSTRPEPVRIRLRVGPWSMPHQAELATLLVVGLVFVGLIAAVVWIARHPARPWPPEPA